MSIKHLDTGTSVAEVSASARVPASFLAAAEMRSAVLDELQRVLMSDAFRRSAKSREFLRYVVRVALEGRVDSLRERSIGIHLLRRDEASYSTAADAAVRVRAGDVRRRLQRYYATHSALAYRITMETGSYAPRFVAVSSAV